MATVANAGSPGRRRISRKTIGQGRPECYRLYLWFSRSRKYLLRGSPGCSGHPAFPAPSVLREGGNDAKLGRIPSRERERVSSPPSLRGALATTASAEADL